MYTALEQQCQSDEAYAERELQVQIAKQKTSLDHAYDK